MPLTILKHLLAITLITAITTYLSFGIYLYLNQRKVLYHPTNQDFYDCPHFSDTQAINHQGTRFYYKNLSPKLAILYHGNASSACNSIYWKNLFEQTNTSYIIVEYAGYAGDPQPPTMDRILLDVNNITNYIQSLRYNQLIYIGESLGSGPAAYQTTLIQPDKLLLIPTYTSVVDVAQHHYPLYPTKLLVRDNFDPQTWLQNYQNEFLIIHGTDDQLLPFYLAETLYKSVPATTRQLINIPQTNHNNIYTAPQTTQAIQKFLTQ